MRYVVQFTDGRIGRTHGVKPLVVDATDEDELAQLVYRHTRPYLMSRDLTTVVDLQTGVGVTYAGMHTGAAFRLRPVPDGIAVDEKTLAWTLLDDAPPEVYLRLPPWPGRAAAVNVTAARTSWMSRMSCWASPSAPLPQWYCSRVKEHTGRHLASDGTRILAVWP
jgi:hypothetical protein